MKYVAAFIDKDTDFFSTNPNPNLQFVGTFAVGEEEDDPGHITTLERMYYVGNKMGPDAEDKNWPYTIRSMSVGDVVVVDGIAYQCDSFGWKDLGS